ncbi:MAG: TIGR01458 family HAD-type hydrolase [Zetaproteobacteria bacterium]|nr:MAG: TIGR01458 family HAD-type hydrolase [Zetaproteobacteria bacterium]
MGDSTLRAVLLDLDGVLYIGNQAIEGAQQSVLRLKQAGYALAGVTNTTTMPRRSIAEKLASMDIPLSREQLFTPAAAACRLIGRRSAKLYVRPELLEDFSEVRMDPDHPEFVLMGDIGGEGYPPETLREIFLHVMDGARLLALHKNRFWQKPDGLHLDVGCFVSAVEYAANTEATVLGKPSRDFFLALCSQLAVQPEACLMVGDDIESDILGAQKAGMKTALVKTGKYREAFVRKCGIRADLVLPSIADLPDAMQLL